MSTTDTRAAFERIANAPLARHSIYTDQYDNIRTQDLWSMFQAGIAQAATEAAKATGTAGELTLACKEMSTALTNIMCDTMPDGLEDPAEYAHEVLDCVSTLYGSAKPSTIIAHQLTDVSDAVVARQPAPVAAQENGGLVRAALIDLMEIEQAATAGEFKQDMTFDFAKQSHYRALFARARAALAATAAPIAAYGLPPFPANGYGTLSSDGIFHAGYIAAISNLPNGLIECMREAAQVLSGQKENRVPLADELDGFASILAATRSQP